MSTLPRTDGPAPHERRTDEPKALSRTQRQLIILGAALGVGLFVMPLLIWLAGSRALGPYVHGDNPKAGPWALFVDYFVGLAHGSAVFWAVALGPAALLLLIWSLLALWRVLPQARSG